MEGIQRVLPSLFCMGGAHGRPAPGVVPSAGLAGGSAVHLDMMLAMAWARCWNLHQNLTAPKCCSSSQSCFSVEGSAPLAEHRAPPAALQAEQQQFGSSWSAGFALLLPGLSSSSSAQGSCRWGSPGWALHPQHWGLAPLSSLGMVSLGVCSVLSSLCFGHCLRSA